MKLGESSWFPYVALQVEAVSEERTTFSIRRATREDAPGILDCLHAAFKAYREAYASAAFLDTVLTPQTIGQRLAEMFVLVAIDDSNRVIGTVACNMVS